MITVNEFPIKFDRFPDGSIRVTIGNLTLGNGHFVVTLKETTPTALMALTQVGEILTREFEEEIFIKLVIETMPDQRADRAESKGMAIPVIAAAAIIGIFPADEVEVFDLHSPASIDALEEMLECELTIRGPGWCFAKAVPPNVKMDFVVAVDKGAIERAEDVAYDRRAKVIYADKHRVGGKIVGHKITNAPGVFEDQDIWVVDDLCDGGATFISIAKLLRETFKFRNLNLYVTHGLFSRGKEELYEHYNSIYCLFDKEKK